MPPQILRVEPLSPGYWDRIPPPVDQELWKRFMNDQDSDSDASGTESEEPMAGPYTASKSTEADVRPVKQNCKHDLTKEVLDDAFNDMIYNILEGYSAEEAAASKNGGKTNTEEAGGSVEKPTETAASGGKPQVGQPSESTTGKDTTSAPGKDKAFKAKDTASQSQNPRAISDLEICQNCKLPRLKYPRIGLTSRPPPEANAQYCANEPPIVLAGHDVHGNAFPGFKPKPNANTAAVAAAAAAAAAASASKSAKAKQAPKSSSNTSSNNNKTDKKSFSSAAAATADAISPTTSQDSPSSSENAAATPSAPSSFEYPQIRTPQMKCPNNCGQWKAVNVMAKHLDICLLGKGRRAGREAREKIGAGTGTGTPGDRSRAGTPKLAGLGGGLKRGRLDDGGFTGPGGETARSGKKQKRGKEREKEKE